MARVTPSVAYLLERQDRLKRDIKKGDAPVFVRDPDGEIVSIESLSKDSRADRATIRGGEVA